MVKAEKTAVVPRLRFPDFQSAPEWKEKKLSAEVFLVSGLHLAPNQYSTSGEVPYFTGPSDFTNSLQNVTKWTKASASTAKQHDTLITVKGSGVGEIWYLEISLVALGRQLMAVRANGCSSRFIFQLLLLRRSRFEDLAAGNLIPGLARGDILDLIVPIPEEDEQQKIADCLTSLDELIAAQRRKVEALKTYKRGLMEQLFPREGETRPRFRFPEYRDAPEWKEVKAGTLFANRMERGDDSLPIYSVTMTDGLVKRTSLDRRIDDLAESTGNKKAYRCDIAYNMMRMWQGACGVAGEECMVSPAYVVLAPQSDVHSPFYGYLFKLPHMLRLFTAHSRGLTEDRLRLYYQDFSNISLPQTDVREQERIADCLMALDARIFDESEKLDDLKTHKSGLLQQLFPSLEAA